MPFAPLKAEELGQLLPPIDRYLAPIGATLVEVDERASFIFAVRRGFVKLQHDLPSGRHRIVRLLGAGSFVGLEALLEPHYRYTAVALTELDLCRIPLAFVHSIEACCPRMHEVLIKRWDASLEQADALILGLLSGEATTRVARLLLLLADMAQGQPPPRMSRQDVAAMLDISPETASRVCSQLLMRGVMVESGNHFEINRAEVERLAAD